LIKDSSNNFFQLDKKPVSNVNLDDKKKNGVNENSNDFTLYSSFSQEMFTVKDYG